MKKILIISALLAILHTNTATCSTTDIDTSAFLDQTQFNQLTFVSGGKSVTEMKNYIQAHPGTELIIPARALYSSELGWEPWAEQSYFAFNDLYSEEKLTELLDEKIDIVQYSGNKCIPHNKDGIKILKTQPPANEKRLCTVHLQSPSNGVVEEAIKRALSWAKIATNTRRVHIIKRTILNPTNKANSFGISFLSSIITTLAGHGIGLSPQHGNSESAVYEIHQVKIYCYKTTGIANSEVQSKKSPPIQKSETPNLPLVSFSSAILDPFSDKQAQEIENSALWLAENWAEIKEKNISIQFTGYSESKQTADNIAYLALTQVITKLRILGINDQELEKLTCTGKIANTAQIKELKKGKLVGIATINPK